MLFESLYFAPMFIDTHTHLYLEQFASEIDQVLMRAKDAGVQHLCLPNIDQKSLEDVHQLAAKDPDHIHPMVGLHPCSVKEDFESQLSFLKAALDQNPNRYVAVGEIGIDLYWDQSTLDIQVQAFKEQIRWAKSYAKPIVIHARNSFNEIFEVLEEEKDDQLFGVFHCFAGGKRHAKKALELGFKLGIGGIITFDQGLPNVIKKIGLEHLVLETDAPYLAPTPHKGAQNESAYIPYIAQKIADDRGCTVQEVEEATTINAQQLFNLSL